MKLHVISTVRYVVSAAVALLALATVLTLRAPVSGSQAVFLGAMLMVAVIGSPLGDHFARRQKSLLPL